MTKRRNNSLTKGALQANLSFDYLLILHDFSKDAVTGSQQDSDDTTGIKFPFDSESRITSEPISHYKPVLSFDYLLILHDFSKDAR